MVLCWRRHGRAGGCRIRKEIIKKIWHTVTKAFIPVIETLDDCMAVRKTWKQAECSLKTEYRDQNLKYSKLTDINMKLVEVKTSEVARRFEQISLVIKTSNCKQHFYHTWHTTLCMKKSADPQEADGQVKRTRAQGGCLGTESRWKTW